MTPHARDIGQSNALFAMDFLEREGIPCLSNSLGGIMARRVQFTPATGAARQMQIAGGPKIETVVTRKKPVADITLF